MTKKECKDGCTDCHGFQKNFQTGLLRSMRGVKTKSGMIAQINGTHQRVSPGTELSAAVLHQVFNKGEIKQIHAAIKKCLRSEDFVECMKNVKGIDAELMALIAENPQGALEATGEEAQEEEERKEEEEEEPALPLPPAVEPALPLPPAVEPLVKKKEEVKEGENDPPKLPALKTENDLPKLPTPPPPPKPEKTPPPQKADSPPPPPIPTRVTDKVENTELRVRLNEHLYASSERASENLVAKVFARNALLLDSSAQRIPSVGIPRPQVVSDRPSRVLFVKGGPSSMGQGFVPGPARAAFVTS